jgi:two-component system nitrogen regulation response regulator GlnG
MAVQHILLVDDEPKLVQSLREVLVYFNQDYRVNVAHLGAEALDILGDQPVDVLVTDLRMPGISGLELIRQVREIRPQIRTMLITAFGSPEIEERARELEAVYLPKPFDLFEFVATVERMLDEEKL